jgi:2-keto-4-pentenoate hydratase/2-oxohepta-3-ene-1,7-dioic acid hydratase in catechol pathway
MWPGKSFDTHGPIRAWVVAADEVDPADLRRPHQVDGELRQEGSTKEIVTGIAELSRVCKLEPGGLIATGTCPANSPVPTRRCLPCSRPRRQAPCRN